MISISPSPLYLTQYTQLHPTFLKEFPLKKKSWKLFLFNKSNHHSLLFLYKRKIIITQARTVNNTRDSSIFIHKKKDIMGECQMFRIGPLPGDLAEIEAFCRIFRASEQLHTAVMDTLCDPKTGECTVSYNDEPDNSVAGDVPVLEEKVVSALACMSSFLQRAKQEVLAGRPAVQSLTDHADTDWHGDKLPPLATFRAEMKNCSYMLESALGSYFSSTDEQYKNIWRRLQRLKNVLYDAGFARSEGSPCHTLLPNWSAVRLFPFKSESNSHDNEVCFWRGGQVTEEGLKWLMEKGYKTIVDLRAERDEDNWSLTAHQEAVKLGNIRVVHIPVEVGNAPTRKQVEEFTSLLDHPENMPLYLHSREGVSRTSAMVSRWREFAIRNNATPCASRISKMNGLSTSNTQDRDGASKISQDFLYVGVEGGPESSSSKNESFLKAQQDHKVQEPFDGVNGKNREGVESTINTDMFGGNSFCDLTPFEAQRLQCDIFSKREVSQLFKKRSISPKSFATGTSKKPKTYPIRIDSADRKYSENAAETLVTTVPSPFSSAKGGDSKKEEVLDSPDSTKYIFSKGDQKASNPTDGTLERQESRNKESAYLLKPGKNDVTSPSSLSQQRFGDRSPVNSNASTDSPIGEEIRDMDPVNGNMCASTTGIVRLQSRKKAEMYLVRTDGVSCSREKVRESSLAFTHPSTQQQMLMWKTPPKTVLLLKKLGDELLEEAKQVASFLHYQENMDVLVEPEVHSRLSRVTGFGFTKTFRKEDLCDLHERVDFVACLGGDGLILHASNLFSQAVPPIVSFNLGSLGFLTAHNFRDFQKDLKAIIHGNNRHDGVYITLRMRLRCEIIRKNNQVAQSVSTILNEVVVNRGSNPYICKIECYERDTHITKVQADGIIVATPTGSTAYSTSAGGSMVHPNVPCMLFTPICPHSLSFRPVILPDSAQLLLKVPEDARSEAYVSFDGKQRQELYKGDAVRICMSEHPLPTVNKSDQTDDWFRSLVRCLNWNDRVEQKSL